MSLEKEGHSSLTIRRKKLKNVRLPISVVKDRRQKAAVVASSVVKARRQKAAVLAKWKAEVEESRRERISSGEAESDGQTVDQLPIEVVEAAGTDGKGGAFGPARRRKRNGARKRRMLKDEEEGIMPRPHRGGQRERRRQIRQHFQWGADNDDMEWVD